MSKKNKKEKQKDQKKNSANGANKHDQVSDQSSLGKPPGVSSLPPELAAKD